ncbi:Lipopolysaccharide assembly protein A [compost metagenome]
MKGQGVLISALVFALIIAIFAVINVEAVQVNFLFTKASMPLILVILASTLLGGMTVGLLGMIRQYKLQRNVKMLEKRIADLTAGIVQPEETEAEEAAEKDKGQAPSGESLVKE